MYFYELALLKSPLENLTFQSEEEIKIGTKVLIKLKQRKALDEAVIVKIVEKPENLSIKVDCWTPKKVVDSTAVPTDEPNMDEFGL